MFVVCKCNEFGSSLLICDRQTDRQTDRQITLRNRAPFMIELLQCLGYSSCADASFAVCDVQNTDK